MMYKWEMAEQIGYRPITTFWDDFSIADTFGEEAIYNTAKRAFSTWKYDYKYLTELIMVINHKSWQYANINPNLSDLYTNLYYMYDQMAIDYLENNEEALSYYFSTLD